MISLTQVHKSFGSVQAVRGVNFEIPRGQVVGILGPNGAGKTTTVRMITAAMPPTSGRVLVAGMDAVARSIDVRRRIGYMPEAAPVYREMRVEAFLRYRAGIFGLAGRRRTEAVRLAAGQCQLEGVLRRRTGELSKGFRQRVGLAAALLHDPEILVLDEPTSGLDPAQIAETRTLIRGLSGKRTMLIVSHILPEVERSCDRIILFARGRVQADGTPDRLIQDLPGAGRYTVEARPLTSHGAGPEMVFRALPGVQSVESAELDGGWVRCLVAFPTGAPDRREAIAAAAAAAGMIVRELRAQVPTLEDVYLRLVAYAEGDPAAAAQHNAAERAA